jgi:hypothetical protein
LSRKFNKQQKLHETSSRLKDGTEILKDVLTLITDDNASKKKKLDAARIIEQSILPLMSAAAGVAQESANISAPVIADAVVVAVPLVIDVHLYPPESTRKPSDILHDPTIVELMMSTFDSSNTLLALDLSSEASLAMADLLYIRLKSRLQIHINIRVRPEQQTHPCLSWAKKNLAVVAAWMIVASQLKNDITHIDNSRCLLASPVACPRKP